MDNWSVRFTSPGRVGFERLESDFGALAPHQMLLKTRYSLVSAGTELACLRGDQAWFQLPATPGYASVGEVIATGEAVTDFAPGDLVYNWGGHRQYNIIDCASPRAMRLKVAADFPLPLAPFIRMTTVAMTALRISSIELGDFVGVLGMGVVGNLAAQLARLQGATVIGLDLNASRLDLARSCGLAHGVVIAPATIKADVAAITGGAGVTTLIEATGVPSALPPALPIMGAYGEVILLGTPRGVFETDLTGVLDYIHLHGHGDITFKGAHEWRYPVMRDSFVKHSIERNSEIAMNLIASGALQLRQVHTHTLSPAAAADAYRGLQEQKDDYIGVVFAWTAL